MGKMDERILEIRYLSDKALRLTKERREASNKAVDAIREFLEVDKLPATLARPFLLHIDCEETVWKDADELEKLLLKTKEIVHRGEGKDGRSN
jgi:hypothetical protein